MQLNTNFQLLMEKGGTISLLPETRRRLEINIPGENRPIYYGIIVIVMVLLIFGGLKFYNKSLNNKLSVMENEINQNEIQRDKKFEEQLLVLKKQFSLVGNILGNHLIWSNIHTVIQNLTPSQVQIEALLGDTREARLDIKGRAVNYTVIAKQIAALLSNEAVADVSLDKVAAFSTGTLEYNMRVFFNKDKFLLNKK